MGVGGATKTLTLELSAKNGGLSRVLLDSDAKVKAFNSSLNDSNKHMSLSKAAVTGVVGGVTALAAGLTYAITKAVAFDKAMRNVNSLTGANSKQFAAMEKQVISMSTKLPQSATTLAEGLYDIASSGFQGADGLKVLDAAARSASAGVTTTAVSARAITGVLNAYGLKAKDAADVSDVLFSTVNLGVITFDELANNLGDVVGSAAAASVGIDQVGAAIATMTLSGVKGAQATTSLNDLMKGLVQPSTAMISLYKQLGYESGASALKQKGLRGVMEDIRKATGGNITSMLQLFPNIEAARGALALMANDGANYAKVADQITDKNKRVGATQKVLDEQMKSVSAQWELFRNRIDASATTIGVALLPQLLKGMKGAQDLGTAIGKMAIDLQQKGATGLNDLRDAGENVVEFLKQIGEEALTMGKGLVHAVGPEVIDTFNNLAHVLSEITGFAADNEKIVAALGIAYAVHATGGVAALYLGLGKVADGMGKLKGSGAATIDFITGLFTPRIEGTADSLTKLGNKAKATGAAMKGAFMAVAPSLAIGGVIALAATAWSAYSKATERARDITQSTTKALQAVKAGGSVQDLQDQLKKAEDFITDYQNRISSFGGKDHKIGITTLVQVSKNYETLGMKDTLSDVQKAAYDAQLSIGQLQYNTVELFKAMGKPLPDAAKWINDVQGANGVKAQTAAMAQMQQVLDQLGPALQAAGVDMSKPWDDQQLTNVYSALDHVRDSAAATGKPTQQLAEAMKVTDTAMGDAATSADKLKTALDGLTGAAIGVDQAQIDWLNGLAKLSGTLKDNGATLSENTQKGRDNRSAIIDQVKSMQDMLVANANAGASQEELTTKLASSRKSLIDVGAAAGVPRKAMEALLSQYNLTPELVQTLIKESGAESTTSKIKGVTAAAAAAAKKKPVVKMDAETSVAQARLNSVENRLDQIDGRTATASVTVNTTQNTYKNLVETHISSGVGVKVNANGGIWNSYDDGKMPQQAMIQSPKSPYGLVQWAEPSTKGEAYIPMAPEKRGRSVQILGQVAKDFGMMLVKMADGGFRYPPFKYPPFRYDPKGGARTAQSRQYLADKAAKYQDYENSRYQAYEEFLDRQRLAATSAGRYGAGIYLPGRSASDTFGSLASSKEAQAQATAELYARKSRSPSDTADDYYRKPTISLKEYMEALKQTASYQEKWNRTLRNLSNQVGADVVTALQGMGEQGEDAIKKLANGSVKDMQRMADQIRQMNFKQFFNDTAADVKGRAQFQTNLQALIKMGRADLAQKFQDMGYDQAAGLAAQAVKSPGSTLTELNNLLSQQESFNNPQMADAMKLAALIQKSGGKLGVIGLSQASGMAVGDVLGLLQSFNGAVFSKIPVAAMRTIRSDQSLLKAGKQPSGHASGTIIPGSDTGYYWGEPESGGESLISHGLNHRRRALQLWRETGRIIGADAPGNGSVTIAPGAVTVSIPVTRPGASAEQIEAAARRAVGDGMTQLVRVLNQGRRG
jgi:TP901 family phage tail tape measure protein